jgi:hypothetical protein
MIIWKGLGYLVGLAGFAGFLIAELLTRAITKSDSYWDQHALPHLGGAILAASLSWAVVAVLRKTEKPRIVSIKETGEELVIRRGDSLFFIRYGSDTPKLASAWLGLRV